MQLCRLIIAFLICTALSSESFAGPFGFSKYNFFAFLESSYFNTKENYDRDGQAVILPTSNYFLEYRSNLQMSYDISNRVGLYTNISFKRAESYGYPLERTNTGPSEFGLGSDQLLWAGFVTLVSDFSIKVPIHSLTPDSALLDDGAYMGTARLHISKFFRYAALTMNGGYQYRTEGLSSLIPYNFAIQGRLGEFFLETKITGAKSMNNDKYTETPQFRTIVTDAFNAGSLIYYAVNPSWTNAAVRLGWRVQADFLITLGAEQTLVGQNSPIGTRFLLGLGFSDVFGGGRKRLKDLKEFTPMEKEDTFKFKVNTKDEDVEPGKEDFQLKRYRTKPKKPAPIR